MSRPKCCRRIGCAPDKNYFKPRGIPSSQLEEVTISLDEFEAVRLADYNGLYQEDAAAQMNISRQTFGRIVESARKKISDALINGKAIKIEGGEVSIDDIDVKLKPGKNIPCSNKFRSAKRINETEESIICPRCGKITKDTIKNNRRIQ